MKTQKPRTQGMKTKRLIIVPLLDEELQQLVEKTEEPELQAAYQEMLSAARREPEKRLWYTAWKISLKADNQIIGYAGFKGPVQNYAVEIGYGIQKEFEGNGYATEAVKALDDWAFSQENVYFIEAETEEENLASKKVLTKLGFQPDGMGEEGPRFELENTDTMWMPIFMCFGMSFGTSFGMIGNNLPIGMSMGIMFGMCVGLIIDDITKKKRAKIREERSKAREVK